MTIYDEPTAKGAGGGPHPLAGVPQRVLDAATDSLTKALQWEFPRGHHLDEEDVRSIAEGMLSAAKEAS